MRVVREGYLVGAPTLRGPRGVGLLVSQIEEGFLAAPACRRQARNDGECWGKWRGGEGSVNGI